MVGVAAYVTYTLNLWGPMINMANAASAQALEEGKKKLREFLESSETGRQAIGMPAVRDSLEMKTRPSRPQARVDDEEDDNDI